MMISSDDFISYFLFNKWTNLDESNYSRYLSVVCIKTFSELFIPLLTNIYENDISKISAMVHKKLYRRESGCSYYFPFMKISQKRISYTWKQCLNFCVSSSIIRVSDLRLLKIWEKTFLKFIWAMYIK